MNGKERMRLAMNGDKPDRVPLMCQLATGHIYKNAGIEPLDYWFTPEGYVQGNVRMVERYGFDGILSDSLEMGDPKRRGMASRVEKLPGGHVVEFADGEKLLFPCDDSPRPAIAKRTEERSIDEVDIAKIDLWESEEDVPEHFRRVLDLIIERKGGELSVHGEVGTAFEKLLYLTGSSQSGLMALLDDPGKCLELLKVLNRGVLAFARSQCRRGIDALKLSSPFAGGSFISRKMYETFVLPSERDVISAVHEEFGIPCYIHTCGKIGDRLDLIVKTGVDGIECLDPIPLGDVDLARAVEQIGDSVFIKGNLDSVHELMNRPRDEIAEIVKQRLEIGMKVNRGYILSTACSLSPRVPPENVELLKETVEKFGRY